MTNQNVPYDVTNLMIPAFGQVRMVTNQFNTANGYTLDVNTLLIESVPFKPQSVTLDCSDVPSDETVIFKIRQINFNKRVRGGNTETFNFPSIPNMVIDVTPTNADTEVRAFFFNYPSFPDLEGVQQVVDAGGGGGTQQVEIVAPLPLSVSRDLTILEKAANAPTQLAFEMLYTDGTSFPMTVILAGETGYYHVLLGVTITYSSPTFTDSAAAELNTNTGLALPFMMGTDYQFVSFNFNPLIIDEGDDFKFAGGGATVTAGQMLIYVNYAKVPV